MNINMDYYLTKEYDRFPCWDMVCEFYYKELGITLKEYSSKQDYRSIAKAFKQAIMEYAICFEQLEIPEEFCIVLCSKSFESDISHVGIYINNRVLHCAGETRFEDMSTFLVKYPVVSLYKLKGEQVESD